MHSRYALYVKEYILLNKTLCIQVSPQFGAGNKRPFLLSYVCGNSIICSFSELAVKLWDAIEAYKVVAYVKRFKRKKHEEKRPFMRLGCTRCEHDIKT